MDLSSYAELAVRLVNTDGGGGDQGDRLTGLDALRALVADMPRLKARIARSDLDGLRMLRTDLRKIFSAASGGDAATAVEILNELLIQHPIHPQISGHDGERWHLHLTESGTIADQYAAGAVMGLAVLATEAGVDRLRVCEAGSCGSVFLDRTTDRSRRRCADHALGHGPGKDARVSLGSAE